jgi:ethanolamine utilization microcompartment shell protein EutS
MRNTQANDANALSIYTLTPGATSFFRNIMVCDVACNLIDIDESLLVDAFGAVTNSAAAVTATISALVLSLFM